MRALFDHPLGWACHMVWVLSVVFVVAWFARALWRKYNRPPAP